MPYFPDRARVGRGCRRHPHRRRADARGEVLAEIKARTTEDVTSGVLTALRGVLGGRADTGRVSRVVIGTTHFTNAVLTGSGLARVAAVRVGLPASVSLPPFCDWPDRLAGIVRGPVFMVEGGHECDGRPIVPLDEQAVAAAGREIRKAGFREIALSAVFAPLDGSAEARAAEILQDVHPDASVTQSRRLGRIGLLGRENAGLLNASLRPLAADVTKAFADAVAAIGTDAPLFIARNDGTIASAAAAAEFPVLSLSSGPTNSMTGAAFLSGASEGVVVDVGGTTTDVGYLRAGFPREAPREVEVGGVRTLFRMPDLLSIALGGGSVVSEDGAAVGPASVGFRLAEEGLVFGGRTPTATDFGVAAGWAAIGDSAGVRGLSRRSVDRFGEVVGDAVAEAVDRMKPDARDCPLLAVGGGAFLPRGSRGQRLDRAPPGVANAVGAARRGGWGLSGSRAARGDLRDGYRAPRGSRERSGCGHRADRSARWTRCSTTWGGKKRSGWRLRRPRPAPSPREPIRTGWRRSNARIYVPLAYLPGDARRVRVRVVGEAR